MNKKLSLKLKKLIFYISIVFILQTLKLVFNLIAPQLYIAETILIVILFILISLDEEKEIRLKNETAN